MKNLNQELEILMKIVNGEIKQTEAEKNKKHYTAEEVQEEIRQEQEVKLRAHQRYMAMRSQKVGA